MTTFSDSALTLIDTTPESGLRRDAWAAFERIGLPTTTDEVWRYAPLDSFVLDRYAAPSQPSGAALDQVGERLLSTGVIRVRVCDGFVLDVEGGVDGVKVRTERPENSVGGVSFPEAYGGDAFALMSVALAPTTIVIEVSANVVVEEPIVVATSVGASAAFVRVEVRLGRGAQATVVEYLDGGADAMVASLSEYRVDEGAVLRSVTYQRLESTAWQFARTDAVIERDATLRQAVIGLGGAYDRSRNDAELRGRGASNELRTTFLGTGDQVHDFRTRQFHVAPRTQSTLLSKGAVADRSRSVYTGLIEIEKGAKGTDARQTNHNLLLSPAAHADSVPNLEIRENDVSCAHASSVGPLDDLQRWYLESRGVESADAERLLVRGFFVEMLDALPSKVAGLVVEDVLARLRSVEESAK